MRKEVTMMRRNPFIPKVILLMPIMVMLIIPLVANMDVKNINVAVVDLDHSILSRRIASDIDESESMRISGNYGTYPEALKEIEAGRADVVLTIPYAYSTNLENGKAPLLELACNGVNSVKGATGMQYASQSIMLTLRGWQAQKGVELPAETVSTINRYNPTLNFRNYMIPALIVVLIIIICGFLPTLNIVGEKESGTIEAINVTPVKKLTFVLSKLIPYWIAGLIVVTVGMLVGWLVYGLRPEGSILSIYLAAILFTLVMSGLGVAIANMSDTVLQSIFVMFAFIMIFQLMSGLFTPITSMPEWAQLVTVMVPPRYFIEIMRSLYLKATPIAELLPQFGALCLFAVGFSLWATLTYRKRG